MPLVARRVVLLVAAGLAGSVPSAADPFAPLIRPELAVPRTSVPIRIDGILDPDEWRDAARATGFTEIRPGDAVAPPVVSEAWITYDDTNLYVALVARDDPSAVRVSVTDRDNIFSDDYFGLMLDTYGDQSWSYELFVNPLGIQGDIRMLSNGNEDMSFDLIWDSVGRVTETGYEVEIAVPFSSLRFPDRPEQVWRANFWRDRRRDVRNQYAWASVSRDDPCLMCQFGTLTGITVGSGRRNVEVIASVIGSQAGELADGSDPRSEFENDDPTGDGSLTVKYGISSTSTGEVTLNPDFSQVESDAGRIDVNQTFALFFPERRPFFQEGSNLFNTWIDAIYTRSVNDPLVAGKLAGQSGRTSFVYLAAYDESSPLILPLEERSEFLLLEESTSNILRVRHSLAGEASVGALVTDRRLTGGGAGTVMGGDALLKLGRNYRVELQAVASRTAEPDDPGSADEVGDVRFHDGAHTLALDGETFWGRAAYASLERDARLWNFDFDYWEMDPSFRTDNGFTTRNDYRQGSGWTGLSFRPNHPWVTEWNPSIGVGRVWSHDGRFKDEWLRPEIWFSTRAQTQAGVQYLISRERFGPETFPGIRIWSVWAETVPSERISFGADTRIGRGIFRDFDDPELARQRNWGVFLRLKPSQRIEFRTDWDYARMDSRERDENLFAGWILRNRLTMNFTREWFLRLIVQYNEFGDRLDVEPLLTYRINPFTLFYLGATSRHRLYDVEDFAELSDSEWRSSSRQFFAKLQYLFQR